MGFNDEGLGQAMALSHAEGLARKASSETSALHADVTRLRQEIAELKCGIAELLHFLGNQRRAE